jgi:hypothetical protein
MRRTVVTMVALLALAGCGADESTDQSAEATAGSSASASASAEAAPAAPLDANVVLGELQAAGLPITGSVVITEMNDSNNLIGRPGQYTSKVAFADQRTGATLSEAEPNNDAGGSVEVFTDEATAQARSKYIQDTLASLGPVAGTEYHYLAGTALVRVTGELPPSVAAEYETAVAALS